MNPKISTGRVNKRFYKQYCYKLEIHVLGASFLRYPETPIDQQFEQRKIIRKSINFAGSWKLNYLHLPRTADIELLEKINLIRGKYEQTLKFRIEEPTLHVYSDDESELHKFAAELVTPGTANEFLTKIFRPATDKHLELLQQGYTVKNRSSDYPFKVLVREGRYSVERKQHILNYLNNLGDLVYMPKHFSEALAKRYDSVWNCYFYVKDKSILTMLAIVDPTFVRDIEEYQTLNDK